MHEWYTSHRDRRSPVRCRSLLQRRFSENSDGHTAGPGIQRRPCPQSPRSAHFSPPPGCGGSGRTRPRRPDPPPRKPRHLAAPANSLLRSPCEPSHKRGGPFPHSPQADRGGGSFLSLFSCSFPPISHLIGDSLCRPTHHLFCQLKFLGGDPPKHPYDPDRVADFPLY